MEALTNDQLNREFDRVQAHAFLGKTAGFLGALACSLHFAWNKTSCKTARTNGKYLHWNPTWFQTLKPKPRVTVYMHELWHVALLHMVRRGSRDPKIWNYACDLYINNMLEAQGYSFEGIENCWKDSSRGTNYAGWTEEDIYDDLIANNICVPETGSWGVEEADDEQDMSEPEPGDEAVMVNTVVRAIEAHRASGAGNIPGGIEKMITQFLKPVVKWELLLDRFMADNVGTVTTWARPSRRSQTMYLPSRKKDKDRLGHLAYFEDVSGSIEAKDSLRFNSEVAHVKKVYNPQKMTLIQFDVVIQDVKEIDENDEFDEIKLIGGGGTSLRCVRDWIIENRPTAAIIFSDLECAPMHSLPFDIPILWVCIRNKEATVPFGDLVHIR